MSYFRYSDRQVYYEESGEGIPLILLHGNTSCGKMFDPIVPALAGKYRVIVPDFLGNGRSDRLDKWPSDLWFDWAKQVKVLCDQLDLQKVKIIGSSGGALAAINAALDGTGISYYGYTMLLHSKTTLRFYFEKESPETDITGITLAGHAAKNYNKKYAYVEVEGIPAYELNVTYDLVINNSTVGSYSALTYVKDVLTDETADAILVNTVTAMYRYHKAAVAYFPSNNG